MIIFLTLPKFGYCCFMDHQKFIIAFFEFNSLRVQRFLSFQDEVGLLNFIVIPPNQLILFL